LRVKKRLRLYSRLISLSLCPSPNVCHFLAKKPLRNYPPRDGKKSALHECLRQHSPVEGSLLIMVQTGIAGDVALSTGPGFPLSDQGRECLMLRPGRRPALGPDLGRGRSVPAPRPAGGVRHLPGRVQVGDRPATSVPVAVGLELGPGGQRADGRLDGPIIPRPARRRIEGPDLPAPQQPLQRLGKEGRTVIAFQHQGAPWTMKSTASARTTAALVASSSGAQASCRPLARSRTAST